MRLLNNWDLKIFSTTVGYERSLVRPCTMFAFEVYWPIFSMEDFKMIKWVQLVVNEMMSNGFNKKYVMIK